MKKFLSLLMAMVMIFTMAPAVLAEEDESFVLLDETAVILDDWGADYYSTAPGDGNITITFDDTTDYDIEYQVLINDIDANRKYSYEDGYTYTWMVSEGDSIYLNVCLMSEGTYVAGSIDFTLVYTPVAASDETEVITGTASFDNAKDAYDGKIIHYTAETNGTLTLNLTPYDNVGIEWKIEVNGNPTWYDTFKGSDTTQSVNLTRGDEIEILISTTSAPYTYVPGTVDYEIVFVPSEDDGDEGGEDDTVLELGDNDIPIPAGEPYSAEYTFTATEDCTLVITPVALTMISPYDGATDVTESIGNFFGGTAYSAIALCVNGEVYTGPVSVAANETITIYLRQNRSYVVDGYAWDATLNLSVEGGEDDTILELGDNDIPIPAGEPLSAEYTFTATEDCTIAITPVALTMISPYDGPADVTEWINEYFTGTAYSTIAICVNDEVYNGPVSVAAGETITVYLRQNRMYAGENYAWDATLNLSVGTPFYEGENYFVFTEDGTVREITGIFTATEDGVIDIDIPLYVSVCGDEIYEGDAPLADLMITVNGETVTSLPYAVDVYEGDTVTIHVENRYADYGIGFEVQLDINYELGEIEPTVLVDGENTVFIQDDARVTSATAIYTATKTGTLTMDIPLFTTVLGEEQYPEEDIFAAIDIIVNGTKITELPYSFEVTEGETVNIVFEKNWQPAIGYEFTLNLSYDSEESEPIVLVRGENYLSLPEDGSIRTITGVYTATKDCDIAIDIPAYASVCGDEFEMCYTVFDDLIITINGEEISDHLPHYIYEVAEGDVITITVTNKWADYGIGFEVELYIATYSEPSAPVELHEGNNQFAFSEDGNVRELNGVYTATKDGVLSIDIPLYNSVCGDEILEGEAPLEDLFIVVNHEMVTSLPFTLNVSEGDVVSIFVSNQWADYGIGFDGQLSISYGSDVLYGDANGDGKINIADANLVRRYAAKLIEESEIDLVAANVNGDDKVNIADANLIRRYVAKLIDVFPVNE